MSRSHARSPGRAPAFRPRPLAGVVRSSLLASAGVLLAQAGVVGTAHAGPQGGQVTAGQGRSEYGQEFAQGGPGTGARKA